MSTRRPWVTFALLISVFMTAVEMTIVATSVPDIVKNIGDFKYFSFIFSSYLLAQVICIPIFGKMADLYGRKRIFIFGMFAFMVASAFCGLSRTMVQLITWRAVQGIGSGAIRPVSSTLAGDLYRSEERHRIQGWFGSIFAMTAILGPALGTLIVGLGHWSWIFFLNIPLGLFATLIVALFLHENRSVSTQKFDWVGALILAIGAGALISGLMGGGTTWPWFGWQNATLASISGVAIMILFIRDEEQAERVLPLWLFREKLHRIAGIATLINGAMLVCYSASIPTFVQEVMHAHATKAGMTLTCMSLGWPLASSSSGYITRAFGYKSTALFGSFVVVLGSVGISLSTMSILAMSASLFLVGAGIGYQVNSYLISTQTAVPWTKRGVATANHVFMRTLGSTMGAAVVGGFLNLATSASHEKTANLFEGGMSLFRFSILLAGLGCFLAALFPRSIESYFTK